MTSIRRQRVRVPWRVIASSHYSDAALAVYIKIAALGLRPEGCTASVAYLAGLLGLSISTVERALTQLMRPAPDDDVVELTSYRRTQKGGRGTTAVRRVRKPAAVEAYVWLPSDLPEALSPRLTRLYAGIAYGAATGQKTTLAELGDVLRHRDGKRAGQPLDPRSVRRLNSKLASLGWISLDPRGGERGRHLYHVHDAPQQPPLTADIHDGSGADLDAGSLATEEEPRTDSPDDEPALGIRRRREQVVARGPVENPGPSLPAALRRPYAGPQLSLAPRIWRVLKPVKPLLPGLSPYVVRQLAREVGRQLDQGAEPERLRWRLEHRFASTDTIRDPGRWLLGAAIVRHGCGITECESGFIWRTGADCHCSQLPPTRPAGPARPDTPRPAPGPRRSTPWSCPCPDCQSAPTGSVR
ncbi:helix-turn-helix domain-containing protein [Streptomyces sp. NBC_01216]|uniref:hypothetical protein n=1 Tax=Streptomyces sp. NBC_01216 TaxID=2903778 RepID=UPI002E0D5A56|nr:helix-turn-helix domain-containing protein [Streptomyces sp. NBC_01216]